MGLFFFRRPSETWIFAGPIFAFKMSLEHQKSPRCFYNKCEKRFDEFSVNSTQTEDAAKAGIAAASNVAGQDVKKTEGLKKCSQCHLAFYCSPDCQKKDWKYHKGECAHVKKVSEDLEKLEANYGRLGILEPPKIMAEDF